MESELPHPPNELKDSHSLHFLNQQRDSEPPLFPTAKIQSTYLFSKETTWTTHNLDYPIPYLSNQQKDSQLPNLLN